MSAILLLASCSTASAQIQTTKIGSGTGVVDANPNPCSRLSNPPTVGQCWDCFQNLLTDCDKNPSGDRRQACYDAANNFFVWCLGRITTSNLVGPTKFMTQAMDMRRNEGFSYDVVFSSPVDTSLIEVYVRDMNNNEPRMQQVEIFVFENHDGSINIFFDNNDLGFEDDRVVGVVTVVRNVNGHVETARADAYNLITPGDLDGNGIVDALDLAQAWDMYAAGDLNYEDFVNFLNDFNSR
jgi:hypothetical protein